MMLNALVWTAGLDVPAEGVASAVTTDDLAANLDDKHAKPAPKPQPAKQPEGGTPVPAAPAKT
jgi:hypothetical protein